MSILLDHIARLAHCNHHAVLYGAFGCVLLLKSRLARREHRFDEAREHAAHGLVMMLLAVP